MTFLMGTSLLVAGLLSVSIPIIIHLLHRQKTTPLQWGAMQFLLQSPLQMKRRKQVDYWILMLIRMALLLLLAFLLARPLWNNSKYNPLATNLSADVAIVVDHSLSMGRHAGDHTLFDEAQGVVDKLTDESKPTLRNGDTLSVVLAEHRPKVLTPVPVGARDGGRMNDLRNQLHQLKPGLTDCSIAEAVESAREVLNRGRNVRKIVLVVSDEQKANWQVGDNAAWQRALGDPIKGVDRHIAVHSYALAADSQTSNISIGDLTIQPNVVGVNRPVQITATVSNSGPKEVAAMSVHLSVNGQEVGAPEQVAMIGAGQTATVRFEHTFASAGSSWVRVWTDVVDALQADNEAVAAVHVWQKLPVLVIDGQLTSAGTFRASQFLEAAMRPVEESQIGAALVQPKIVSVSDGLSAKLDNYYMVVLNDVPQLPEELESRLADYTRSGHGVWVILGPRSTAAFISRSRDQRSTLFTAALKSQTPRNEKTPPPIEVKDPNNPMVALVTAAERNALAGAVTKQWWSLSPKDADDQVVLASTTGDPLIFERPLGNGRVAVWCTSVDGAWNNWPAMPNFVPLVNETVYHLCSPQTRSQNSGNLEAGSSIAWSGPANPGVQEVDVTLPDGSTDKGRKATYRNGRWEFQYPNAFLPGLYQLRFNPTEVPQPIFYGVAIDRRELDNTPLSSSDQDWLTRGGFLDQQSPQVKAETVASIITQEDKGIEMWKWLGGLVLLSLVAETFMTYRMAGLQQKVDVTGAGLTRV
ncbi:MAG: hypothetical protein JWN24_3198 [Phycisphaerales bacterium]|nr:hypothetical protein [Phycisphaerales bacterium]